MLVRKYFRERADQGWINVLLWGRTLPQSTWASGSRLTPTLSLHGGSGGWALSLPRPAPPSPVPPPRGKRGPSSSFFPGPAPGSLAACSDRSRLDSPSPPLCHSFMHTLCLPPPVWAEREGQGLAQERVWRPTLTESPKAPRGQRGWASCLPQLPEKTHPGEPGFPER